MKADRTELRTEIELALETSEADPQLLLAGAYLYIQERKLREAEPLLARLCAAPIRTPAPFEWLGMVSVALGKPDQGIAAYRKAMKLGARSAPLLTNLGVLHAQKGETERARAYWLEALTIDPNYAPARQNLGP